MSKAKSFDEWFNSNDNPLRHASDTALYFAMDGLKAAFKAGERHGIKTARDTIYGRDTSCDGIFQ